MREIVPYEGLKLNMPVLGEVDVPVKVRISGRFIPDITFDPTQKRGEPGLLMRIIQPKVYIQIGPQAFEIDYQGNVRKTDPAVFKQPTLLDEVRNLPAETQAILAGLTGFMLFKLLRCIF